MCTFTKGAAHTGTHMGLGNRNFGPTLQRVYDGKIYDEMYRLVDKMRDRYWGIEY